MITENRDKGRSFVKGQMGYVHSVIDQTILIRIADDRIIRVYPVSTPDGVYYPFVLRYAHTIHEIRAQTFDSVILWFDSRQMLPGSAFSALSCVKRRNDLRFLINPTIQHFTPATDEYTTS